MKEAAAAGMAYLVTFRLRQDPPRRKRGGGRYP